MNYPILHSKELQSNEENIRNLFIDLQRSAQKLGIDCRILGEILDNNKLQDIEYISYHFDEILNIVAKVSEYYTWQKGRTNDNVHAIMWHAIMWHAIMEKSQFRLGVSFVRWFLDYLYTSVVWLNADESTPKKIHHSELLDEIETGINKMRDILDAWQVQSWQEFRWYLDLLSETFNNLKWELEDLSAGFQFKSAENARESQVPPRILEEDTVSSAIAESPRRKEAWQNLWFSSEWGFVSNQKKQEVLRNLRTELTHSGKDKELEKAINQDIKAANDEHFPDGEISDDMIMKALRSAQIRKDGGMLQSIKNNLIKRALAKSGEDIQKTEHSIYLSEHIENASKNHPVKIRTVEYSQFDITQAEKMEFEWAKDSYYKVNVTLNPTGHNNPQQVTFLIRSDRFTVGDFSQKIIWVFSKEGKFTKTNVGCTIRDIESHKHTWSDKLMGSVKSSVGKIGNWFSRGKNS